MEEVPNGSENKEKKWRGSGCRQLPSAAREDSRGEVEGRENERKRRGGQGCGRRQASGRGLGLAAAKREEEKEGVEG